jgi:hypothetical protein
VSTSKTTALVWTYTIAAALASFVIARWLGHPGAFDELAHQGVDVKYALLFGGPLGAAILAKAIVSAQIDNGTGAKPPADSPSPGQLVQDDSGQADLGDLQYLLFNVVALLFFYGEILRVPQAGLPSMPDVLVGLTSVAAVGYVGKKALTSPGVISDVTPKAQTVGGAVKLVTSGIVKVGDDLSLVTVLFGAARAAVADPITTTTTQGVLLDTTVPDDAAGSVDITVSVPNGTSATWPGFKVEPEIIAAGSKLTGAPGEVVTIATRGVSGLGPRLLGLAVTIDTAAAPTVPSPDDPTASTLSVTIPRSIVIPPGQVGLATKIVLTTPGGSSDAAFTVSG